jgi:hypothetical protein
VTDVGSERQASADEIEVTPAMIEAGAAAFVEEMGDAEPYVFVDAAGTVTAVYRAMAGVSRAEGLRGTE